MCRYIRGIVCAWNISMAYYEFWLWSHHKIISHKFDLELSLIFYTEGEFFYGVRSSCKPEIHVLFTKKTTKAKRKSFSKWSICGALLESIETIRRSSIIQHDKSNTMHNRLNFTHFITTTTTKKKMFLFHHFGSFICSVGNAYIRSSMVVITTMTMCDK